MIIATILIAAPRIFKYYCKNHSYNGENDIQNVSVPFLFHILQSFKVPPPTKQQRDGLTCLINVFYYISVFLYDVLNIRFINRMIPIENNFSELIIIAL